MKIDVRVQTEDFSIDKEYRELRKNHPNSTGAICTFSGLVREFGDRPEVTGMFLEHYPGMTEQSLKKIVLQAGERWRIHEARVIHRVGNLHLSDQIVFVAVSAAHRSDAFAACEFIMDYLKSDAPFWKKEVTQSGSQWVEAKQSDKTRRDRWSDE